MSELTYWERQFQTGRISRREFVGRAALLGVASGLATTMFGQIGDAAEPKKGGLARIALPDGATTDTLDPGTWPATFTQNVFSGSMCNKLTMIETDGSIAPDLAESMEFVEWREDLGIQAAEGPHLPQRQERDFE